MNFHVFKKKEIKPEIKKTDKEKDEVCFPTAKTMRERTTASPLLTAEEILIKMNEAAENGKRECTFLKARISEQLHEELKEQGYKVNIIKAYGHPNIIISW